MSAGDLVSQEAKYHAQCLASLYNRARQESHTTEHLQEDRDSNFSVTKGIALAELVLYIEDARADKEIVPYKLSHLS